MKDIENVYNKAIGKLQSDVSKTLSSIPTITSKQITEVNNLLAISKHTVWKDPDLTATKIKAILEGPDYVRALNTALRIDPATAGWSNPLQLPAATKVELAAEVQSTLWGTYSSDYDGFYAAKYYRDRIEAFNPPPGFKEEFMETWNDYFPNKEVIKIDNKLALLKEQFANLKKLQPQSPKIATLKPFLIACSIAFDLFGSIIKQSVFELIKLCSSICLFI